MTLAESIRTRARQEYPNDKDGQIDWLCALSATLYRGFSAGCAKIADQTGPSDEEVRKRDVASVLLTTEEIEKRGEGQ